MVRVNGWTWFNWVGDCNLVSVKFRSYDVKEIQFHGLKCKTRKTLRGTRAKMLFIVIYKKLVMGLSTDFNSSAS